MSLLCDETGRYIDFGEPLKAGTRRDVQFYSAFCKEVIDKIPASERRPDPCKPGEGGVDIHFANSSENFNGAYTITNFTLLNFCFSISQKAAEKYLPKHLKRYAAP